MNWTQKLADQAKREAAARRTTDSTWLNQTDKNEEETK